MLNYIYKMEHQQGYVLFSDIKRYLQREKTQVSDILSESESRGWIIKSRTKKGKIFTTTELGKNLIERIYTEFSSDSA